jgi:hypothetical protein
LTRCRNGRQQPLPKPLFVGIAAGHAAERKVAATEALARLGAAGIAAVTDPIALVQAAAEATRNRGC